MTDIVESWMWRDPEEIIERLLERTERIERRPAGPSEQSVTNNRRVRDRYYTQERRLHVKRLMKGKR